MGIFFYCPYIYFQLLLQSCTNTALNEDGCLKASQSCLKLCVSGLSLQCAPGRHLRESLGDQAELQLASRSLLQGITHLMELGQECITEGQTSPVHSRRRLQAAVCRRQVYFLRGAFKQSSLATLANIQDGQRGEAS